MEVNERLDGDETICMEGKYGRPTIEECRPSAAALELGGALVEGRPATRAGIDTFLVELVVLAGPCGLRALLPENPELHGIINGYLRSECGPDGLS